MAITSSNDFGRFTTNQAGEDQTHGLDAIDRPRSDAEPPEGFGIPGGLPRDFDEREAERLELVEATVGGEYIDPPPSFNPRDPNEDAPDDMERYGPMNPPRHDRWADENSPYPTPDRVVPSTPTNANPTFADYQVPTQERPGRADGADAEVVAELLGDEPTDPGLSFQHPPEPRAGEGSFVVREPTEEATGVTSPTGHPHNDPTEDRGEGVDTYYEAKETAAEHGGTIRDFGTEDNPIPAIPVAGSGSEPAGVPVPESNAEAGAVPTGDAPAEAGEPDLSGAGDLPYTGPANTSATAEGADADVEPDVAAQAEGASSDEAQPQEGGAEQPPPKSALKADWIEYVLRNYDTDLETVSAMTKDEIIETYGS